MKTIQNLFVLFFTFCLPAFAGIVRVPDSQSRFYELVFTRTEDGEAANVIRGTVLSVELNVDQANSISIKVGNGNTRIVPNGDMWPYSITFKPIYSFKGSKPHNNITFVYQSWPGETYAIENNLRGKDLIFYLGKDLQPFTNDKTVPCMSRTATARQPESNVNLPTENKFWEEVKLCLQDPSAQIRRFGLNQFAGFRATEYLRTGLAPLVEKIAQSDPETALRQRANTMVDHYRQFDPHYDDQIALMPISDFEIYVRDMRREIVKIQHPETNQDSLNVLLKEEDKKFVQQCKNSWDAINTAKDFKPFVVAWNAHKGKAEQLIKDYPLAKVSPEALSTVNQELEKLLADLVKAGQTNPPTK